MIVLWPIASPHTRKLLIRELIERVDINYNGTHWDIDIKGKISALVALAQNAKNPTKYGLNHDVLASSTKMVAGVGLNLGRTKSW